MLVFLLTFSIVEKKNYFLTSIVGMMSTVADCGDDLDMVNASGSIMETSDNFAKKEKKSGSFVR